MTFLTIDSLSTLCFSHFFLMSFFVIEVNEEVVNS